MLRSRNVRDVAMVFAATMAVNVFGYVYHMACSRVLGVAAYGSLATLVAGYSILIALATVLNLTTVKLAAELHALEDHERLQALYRAMLTLCLRIAAAVAAIGIGAGSWLTAYAKLDWPSLVLTTASACAAIIVPASRGILQGTQDYRGLSAAMSIEVLFRLLFGVGFAALGYGAPGAVSGFALGSVVSGAYSSLLVHRYFAARKLRQNGAPVTLDIRRIVLTTAGLGGSTLALTVLGFIDVVLVKHLFPAYEAGLYGVLSLAGKIVMFVVAFIPTMLLPKAVEAGARGESARPILLRAMVSTAILAAAILAVFYTVPQFIINIMAGHAYLPVAPLMFSYGLATALLAATTLVATYLVGTHRFAFIPRLLAVAVAEIAVISQHHANIVEVVNIVILANALGFTLTIIPQRRTQQKTATKA